MQAELAFPISVMAAAEASEAKQLAERAEMQAFVNGYSHTSATPEERARYVEVVKTMYPQPTSREEISPAALRCTGGVIVGLFLIAGFGALYGHLRHGDVGEGIMQAVAAIFIIFIALFFLGLFCGGVALLLGY